MRYDDEKRPKSIGADSSALQVNGSPLPCVTLIRPMLSEAVTVRCGAVTGCECEPPCEYCERASEETWGWLCYIHAHIEGSRFGYHTAWVRSVDTLLADWIEDPEEALRKYFKYSGPKPKRQVRTLSPAVGDLFGEDEE